MSFWTDLIWVGNTLYPRWFVCLVTVMLIAAIVASSYGGFRLMKFLFDLVTGAERMTRLALLALLLLAGCNESCVVTELPGDGDALFRVETGGRTIYTHAPGRVCVVTSQHGASHE